MHRLNAQLIDAELIRVGIRILLADEVVVDDRIEGEPGAVAFPLRGIQLEGQAFDREPEQIPHLLDEVNKHEAREGAVNVHVAECDGDPLSLEHPPEGINVLPAQRARGDHLREVLPDRELRGCSQALPDNLSGLGRV